MIDNTDRNLLLMDLEELQRWRREAWEAFEHTGDRRTHEKLLAVDKAVEETLRELRDPAIKRAKQ